MPFMQVSKTLTINKNIPYPDQVFTIDQVVLFVTHDKFYFMKFENEELTVQRIE